MASIIVPVDGEKAQLPSLLSLFASAVLHLYQNNYTPVAASLVGDFTEATFTGYTPQSGLTFGAVYVDGSNRAAADTGTYTFTLTGGSPQTIYGYYVTDAGGTQVLFACRASAPFILNSPGDDVATTVTYTLKSEF